MGATTSGLSAVPPCYGSTAENGSGSANGGGGDDHEGSLRLPALVSRKARSVSGLSSTSCVGFLASSSSHAPAGSPVASHPRQHPHPHPHQQQHIGGSSPNGLSTPGAAKSAKLSTLRKKMCRFRRKPAIATDYGKQMRDFIASWSHRELLSLRQEYEALSSLKELYGQAMSARASYRSAKSDLNALFESQMFADARLTYHGAVFPVHKAILCARCAVFKQLLAGAPTSAAIPVHMSTPGISGGMFACLLKYLYTGQIGAEAARLDNWDTLGHLCREFGTPNLLERDLKALLDSAAFADCVLVFSSQQGCGQQHVAPALEVPCHRAVIAARSNFFRGLVLRRDQPSDAMLRVVLDEAVLPRKFALVLLNALYTDRLDLTLLLRHDAVQSPNGLARHPIAPLAALLAANAGASSEAGKRDSYPYASPPPSGSGVNPSLRVLLYEVTELFQIAQFLEFGALAKACEDFLVEQISLDTLVQLLRWSAQPHGSAWVHRQALQFLQEEFLSVANSSVLHDLNKTEMAEVLRSPFLQAPESEVLHAVVRWGEHELLRIMDERAVPNILSHMAGSQPATKKCGQSKRAKEVDNSELAELLSDLLPLVRLQHVLPAGHSDLVQAVIRRELVRCPPPLYLVQAAPADFVHCWIRGAAPPGPGNARAARSSPPACGPASPRCSGSPFMPPPPPVQFMPPRLFGPFYEEVKALLSEHFRSSKALCDPPGLVNARPPSRQPVDLLAGSTPPLPSSAGATYAALGRAGSGAVPQELEGSPVPARVLEAVRSRSRALEQQLLVQRAFLAPCADRPAVLRQLQLRALRECDLPDTAIAAAFLPAERHHGLVAAAAAASAEENNSCSANEVGAARPQIHHHPPLPLTFPPDVTLAQQPTGQRVRRDQTSSDEYEDTACIL